MSLSTTGHLRYRRPVTLDLRTLDDSDESAFLAGLRAWDGDDPSWHSFLWGDGLGWREMLEILEREQRGVGLAPGRVPHTMLYAFVDGQIVGRCSVRHALNDHLRHRGGHIGYAVAPPFRQRGHAGEILHQGLAYCRDVLGLPSVLLTCDDDNAASWRTIERAGGRLAGTALDESGVKFRRYWIELPARPA